MHTTRARNLLGNAGRAPGFEIVHHDGTRHYVSHRPYYVVSYYSKTPVEEVCLRVWEDRFIAYGHNLLAIYEQLKANSREILQETGGIYNPNDARPFIERIDYLPEP